MYDDFDRCYGAVKSSDARFDGWFITAVHSTRIYCRPSCPARPPLPQNVTFYPTAAAAQRAGFRACKRCRPDAAPGSPEWNVRGDVVGRAMRMIADGAVERTGVNGLAESLGYSARQLQRLLRAEVGAGPLALARAQRTQTARILIETTDLPLSDVAFAAGFASIRQFNDTVRAVCATTPTMLRSRATARSRTRTDHDSPGVLTLRLPVRTPFSFRGVFGHLAACAVSGCEEIRDGAFRRTLRLPHGNAVVGLRPADDHVRCRIALDDFRDLTAVIARCRRLLDLDADPQAIGEALGTDRYLKPLIAHAPGQRIPRTVDEAELAIRVLLSQQVSLKAAQTHTRRLVAAYGDPIVDPEGGLTHVFPTVQRLADLDPDRLALPRTRRRAFAALVAGLADGRLDLSAGADWDRARHDLTALPGVGVWTAEVIAMRGLGDPDAFPATDLGVQAAARHLGLAAGPRALISHGARWRPWRSYATQYLWSGLDHAVNVWPPASKESA